MFFTDTTGCAKGKTLGEAEGAVMNTKTVLLCCAALLAAVAAATGADARPIHPARSKPPSRPSPASRAEPQPDPALVARLNQLEQLVQAQAQQMAALQAQVAQTQGQVQQVASDAEAVQNQLDSVPQQILTTIGELPKPKPSWAEKTQISGRMFFNLSSITQKNNGIGVSPSGTAFDFKRFYIGIDHQFNDVYSANLTMDAEYHAGVVASSAGTPAINPLLSDVQFFIKKAYLQARYASWLTLRAGSADLPWIPFVEDLYGYRYVEQTLIDRTKFGVSGDWGIHALGSFDLVGNQTGPVVSYALAVVDGGGYRRTSGAGAGPRTASMDVEGRVSARWMDWTLGVGGYSGRLYNHDAPTMNTQVGPVVFRNASRFNAILAWTSGPYRAGMEYFSANNWTATTNKVTGDKADGWSVFGSWAFQPEWAVFGKLETVKPNKTVAPNKKDNYWNLGLQYEPVKIVDLSIVYKRDKVENGALLTGNGTIGNNISIVGGPFDGTFDEVGVFGQFRW